MERHATDCSLNVCGRSADNSMEFAPFCLAFRSPVFVLSPISRLGCYLLDVRSSGASGVELIGYGGYKFVG